MIARRGTLREEELFYVEFVHVHWIVAACYYFYTVGEFVAIEVDK
jgi:hypothetical protein